jgi:hypothetical protein
MYSKEELQKLHAKFFDYYFSRSPKKGESYPLASFLDALQLNIEDEKNLEENLKRYTDLHSYYDILYTVKYDDLPLHINNKTPGILCVIDWRLNNLGR